MDTKKAGVLTLLLSSVLAGFGFIGCSGTTTASVGGGGTTTPTITSVSAASSASSIAMGQTATCTATVQGTGAYSSSVTWTATNGTITAGGVLTPASAGTSTCTATSTQDSTKSGSASITVTAVSTSTITSVTVSGLPASITLGQSATCVATVTGTGGFNSNVTWTAANGTITQAGVLTPSATGTTSCTAISTQDSTKFGSETAAVISASPTITSVSASCNPTTIMATQTSQCTATVQGTGAYTSAVAWTATNGTITSTGVFTGSGAGPAVVTAISLQAGYTTVSGSANITVTAAKPVITSINLPTMYCDAECGLIGNVQINGSGFQSGDVISSNPSGYVYSSQFVNSTQILITLPMDTAHTSPGWLTFSVSLPDGSNSSSVNIAYLGNQNLLAISASGELYSLDEAAGTVWEFEPNGKADTSANSGRESGIAADDKTGNILLSQSSGGATMSMLGQGAGGDGNPSIGVGARNGNGCVTQPSVNHFSCIPITQTSNTFQPFTSITVGSQPWSLAMGLFGTETDAFVFSRDGTPTLWKVNVSGTMTVPTSQSIPGITPVSTLQASNPLVGGWQVAVFDSGPAIGTVSVLSTADNLLTTLNTSTMEIIQQVKLPDVPFRMVADKTNGNLIIANADQANVRTTFSTVNPTTGVVTPLTSTSAILAVGLQVSSDGKSIYACQRTECDVLANK